MKFYCRKKNSDRIDILSFLIDHLWGGGYEGFLWRSCTTSTAFKLEKTDPKPLPTSQCGSCPLVFSA